MLRFQILPACHSSEASLRTVLIAVFLKQAEVVSAEATALKVRSGSNLHYILNSIGRLLFSGVSISVTRFSTLKLLLIFNNRDALHLNGAFQSAFQVLNNLRIAFFHFYRMSTPEDLKAVLRC